MVKTVNFFSGSIGYKCLGGLWVGLWLAGCAAVSPTVDLGATVDASVKATQQANVNVQATIEAAVAATVQAQPTDLSAATPAPIAATPIPVATVSFSPSDLEQVQTLINNETQATVAHNLALLQSIFAPDAAVIDRAGTPENLDDDTIWRGWPNIQRRYEAFFSTGVSSISLVNVSIHIDGNQAMVTHDGAILNGVLRPDHGVYTLSKTADRWLITGLEYGNQPVPAAATATTAPKNNGAYILAVGNQHRYEEPWGGDRGDPCLAWQTKNFDDTQPYYRGFNVELLLTNNSAQKVPDDWPISFTTAQGKAVKACYYKYQGSGPPPGATSSVTFFTVVDRGDFVSKITLNLAGQTVQLCLDGNGKWWSC